jgi:hypothetical protein
VAHFHPHLHVLMSDGAYRRDGSFVPLPEPEPMVLEARWQRAVLAEFVRRGWLEEDAAAGMMSWPHSGFGAYVGPRIEEREGQLRVARYAARASVAESRLRYHADRAEVELVAEWPALRARRRRWAELLRMVFRVEVEVCPDPPAAGAPRGRGADPRVRDGAGGGAADPRSSGAPRGGSARRAVGGGGGGARVRAGGVSP